MIRQHDDGPQRRCAVIQLLARSVTARIYTAIWLAVYAPTCSAAFYTGADLYALGGTSVLFPSTQPVLNGTSLVFGPGGSGDKLLVFPLHGAMSAVSLAINLTRLPCGTAECGVAIYDHDPNLALSDGTHLVGVVVADNDNGSVIGETLLDTGTIPTSRLLAPTLFVNAGYPAYGGAFDVLLDFVLAPEQTIVTANLFSSSGTFQETTRALDNTSGISFVFLRDSDGHASEQYQINSFTITESVPEPISIGLLSIGLLALIASKRKRKK